MLKFVLGYAYAFAVILVAIMAYEWFSKPDQKTCVRTPTAEYCYTVRK